MGENTNIPWCDATWNPWIGCHKISSGCKNCYMFRELKRYGNDPEQVKKSRTMFTAPLKWNTGKGKNIFVCSWSDFFIEEADSWRPAAWEIIKMTSNSRYIILTKRVENIASRLPEDWGNGYPNVILMVTAESEKEFYERVPRLLNIPAVAYGASIEPILGNINMGIYCKCLNWIIAGGESGPKNIIRKDNMDWYRALRDQCIENQTAYFLKQAWVNDKLIPMPQLDGIVWSEYPLFFRR